MDRPEGVGLDSSDRVFVADTGNHLIKESDLGPGVPGLSFGGFGSGDGQLFFPSDVAIATNGDFIVADTSNHRIQIFDSAGTFKSAIGIAGSAGSGDGQFEFPEGVAVAPSGDIVVADTFNHRIQIFDSAGTFKSAIGSAGSAGNEDGQFVRPEGVAVDPNGDIVVADSGNSRIQIFELAAQPEIVVHDGATTGDPVIADGGGPIDFGTTNFGSPITRTFNIENTGSATLNVSNLSLPSGFSLIGNFPGAIGIGASDTFQVQLDALGDGTFSGTLQFTTDDGDENPFNFDITGMVDPAPVQQPVPVRELPRTYRAEDPFGVSIFVFRVTGGILYDLTETVPAGWTVSDISNGGTENPGTITWSGLSGSFTGTGLRYSVTPPVAESGERCFSGEGVFGGVLQVPTAGDDCVRSVIQRTFAQWAALNGVILGEMGDDDNDGDSNLLEFAFGTNPRDGGSRVSQRTLKLDGVGFDLSRNPSQVTCRYNRAKDAAGITFRVESANESMVFGSANVISDRTIGEGPGTILREVVVGVPPLASSFFVRIEVTSP